MLRALALLAALLVGCACVGALEEKDLTVVWQSKDVPYKWGKSKGVSNRDRKIQDGSYKPDNNCPAGLKFFKGDYFVTVPRWRSGVPSTLNKVNLSSTFMLPFPDNASQNFSAGGFHYVQSMEIDSKGRMWVIDTGRRNIFEDTPIAYTPKLDILDAATGEFLHRYTFPEDVASPETSFLNDIVVDDSIDFAYISDASADGAIVVFDLKRNDSWRVHHETMKADPSAAYSLDGVDMSAYPIPIDGIALSADKTTVFYNALLGNKLYSVPTEELRARLAFNVVNHGIKPPSDGLACSDNGKLYFGSLPENAIYEYDPSNKDVRTATKLVTSAELLSWPDTFAFDDSGNLLVLSNRLHKFVSGTIDWTDVNFRIVAVPVNGGSYVHGPSAAATAAATAAAAAAASSSTQKNVVEEFFPAYARKCKGVLCCASKIRDFTVNFTKSTFGALPDCVANLTQCRNNLRASLAETYETDALKSAVIASLVMSAVVWLLGELTGDLSWVDRLWSILPPCYVLHFLSYNPSDPRLQAMAALTVLWGTRLTYNFWRKGGYTLGGEDYRWEHVRRDVIPKALQPAFNLFFVAIFQNILLMAIALPAHVALQNPAPLALPDLVACLAFTLAFLLETFSDEQQWAFQQSKRDLLPRLPEFEADYERGFLTSGLFSLSRHPNFFAEQSIWVALYLFAVSSSHSLCLPVAAGALTLIALFQGSTDLTEKISLAKYPRYAEYVRTTSRLLPWFPLPATGHEHNE